MSSLEATSKNKIKDHEDNESESKQSIGIESNEDEDGAQSRDPLTDIDYICKSTTLITESLRNGKDIAQLPNGDIIVTERKIVHLHYTWDPIKGKMVRIS